MTAMCGAEIQNVSKIKNRIGKEGMEDEVEGRDAKTEGGKDEAGTNKNKCKTKGTKKVNSIWEGRGGGRVGRNHRKRKEKMEILHFNCRGWNNEERMYEFEKSVEKIKYDIIGLSEIRKLGENLIQRRNGNYFYYYGNTKDIR